MSHAGTRLLADLAERAGLGVDLTAALVPVVRRRRIPQAVICFDPSTSSRSPTEPSTRCARALRRHRYWLFRAWELKEGLRDLYRAVHPDDADLYLERWITTALRSRIPAFINLARQMRPNFDHIIAAVQLGLSNARLEGINAIIRLIQRRGYGYRSIDSLATIIYLCLGKSPSNYPHKAEESPCSASGRLGFGDVVGVSRVPFHRRAVSVRCLPGC